MRKILVVVALAVGACGSDAPSCNEAFSHFYAKGCVLVDSSGAPYSQADVIVSCQQIAAAAPDNCIGKLDDWLSCLNGIENANTCTSCSGEQMKLIECR